MSNADNGQLHAPIAVCVRFQCDKRRHLLHLRLRAWRIEREVKRTRAAYVTGKTRLRWRERELISLSIWSDQASMFSMGGCARHIDAAHYALNHGVRFQSDIMDTVGSWSQVMRRAFEAKAALHAPAS